MLRKWKHLPFERYADDVIVHCRSRREANLVRAGAEKRLSECGLELHSEKTKLVYCKDPNRLETAPTYGAVHR
jgi:retron-type reverse transcriptase